MGYFETSEVDSWIERPATAGIASEAMVAFSCLGGEVDRVLRASGRRGPLSLLRGVGGVVAKGRCRLERVFLAREQELANDGRRAVGNDAAARESGERIQRLGREKREEEEREEEMRLRSGETEKNIQTQFVDFVARQKKNLFCMTQRISFSPQRDNTIDKYYVRASYPQQRSRRE